MPEKLNTLTKAVALLAVTMATPAGCAPHMPPGRVVSREATPDGSGWQMCIRLNNPRVADKSLQVGSDGVACGTGNGDGGDMTIDEAAWKGCQVGDEYPKCKLRAPGEK